LISLLTLWHRAALGIFETKCWNACDFAWEFLCSGRGYGPGGSVKRRSKSSSLHSFFWQVF